MKHGAYAEPLEINEMRIRDEDKPFGVPLSNLLATFSSLGGSLTLEIDRLNYKYKEESIFR